MNPLKNQRGISLIEVLASLVIISILFSVVSSFIISSYKQSNSISSKYSSLQLAESLLDVYKKMDYPFLLSKEGNTESINIQDVLRLDSNVGIENLTAKLNISKHANTKLKERVLVIQVTVTANDNGIQKETKLEGYKRK